MNDAIAFAIIAGVQALAAVAAIGLGIPLIRRRVPPNETYGVRVPATLADEVVWYDVNARGGWHLVLMGIGYLIALGLSAWVTTSWDVTIRMFWPAGLFLAALLVDVVVLWKAADRQLVQRHAEGHFPDALQAPLPESNATKQSDPRGGADAVHRSTDRR